MKPDEKALHLLFTHLTEEQFPAQAEQITMRHPMAGG